MVVIRGAVKAQRSLPFVEPESKQVLKGQYRGEQLLIGLGKVETHGEYLSLV